MSNSPIKDIISCFHDGTAESCIYLIEIPCNSSHDLLTAHERKKYLEYRYPKRQDEWFAGRLAAKSATAKLLNQNKIYLQPSEIEIANRNDGRPYLILPAATSSRLDISISHSKEFALAMVSKQVCGIDIQVTNTTLERVEKRFCSSEELNILESNYNKNKDILLTKLWAAKEAIKKAVSISGTMLGFTELQLRDITFDQDISYFHLTPEQAIAGMPDVYMAKVSYFSNYAIANCTINRVPPEIWERKDA